MNTYLTENERRILEGARIGIAGASGLAGWGRSGEIVLRRMGPNVIAIGDGTTSVGNGIAPHSPRVGIAAAMEANTVIAWLLDRPV